MPRRSGSAKGDLRAEDLAFCLEGAIDRAYATRVDVDFLHPDLPTNVDKYIIGSRWQAAINLLHESGQSNRTLDADAEFASAYLGSELPWGPAAIYPQLTFHDSLLESDAAEFAVGRPFNAEEIQKVFNDMRRIRRFWHVPEAYSAVSLSVVSQSQTGGGPNYQPTTLGLWSLVANQAWNNGSGPGWSDQAWRTNKLVQGSIAVSDASVAQYAASAKMLLTMQVYDSDFDGSRYYVAVVNASISGNNVTASASDFMPAAEAAIAAAGARYSSSVPAEGTSHMMSVGLVSSSIFVVFELNNRTKWW